MYDRPLVNRLMRLYWFIELKNFFSAASDDRITILSINFLTYLRSFISKKLRDEIFVLAHRL